MPLVRVILGSKSDLASCEPLKQIFEEFGVEYDFHVSSAHRAPERTAKLAREAENEGVKVIVAAAGMAAHLPGVVASHTVLPVIGIPLSSGGLGGLDALLSIAQMPPGVPVASMAVGGAKNAALLAIQILGQSDPALREKFRAFKQAQAEA